MFTTTSYQSTFGVLVNSTEATVLANGLRFINDSARLICGMAAWPFLQKSTNISTTAGTQDYTLPYDYNKLVDIYCTSGTYRFVLRVVPSREEWDVLNQSTTPTSDYTQACYIQGNTISLWPKPASNWSSNITLTYKARYVDLSAADYTTNTVSATNGSTTVTGSSTVWIAPMAGRWLQIIPSTTASTCGDNLWYEIASASATSITLVKPYGGTTVSGASYIVGQAPIIPEAYQELPMHRAAYMYFSAIQPETPRANLFKTMFDEGVARMKADCLATDTSPVIDPGFRRRIPANPNSYPMSIGS